MFASRNRFVSYRLLIACLVLTAFTGSLTVGQEQQQQYITAPVKLPRDQANKLKVVYDAALRSPAGFGASEADVGKYLTEYFFPTMTQVSPTNLAELADLRKKLMSKDILQAANAGSQQYLIDQTFKFARGMARGNFHPAVRYNAVLMLGDLDQQLAAGTNLPVPHAKATQELLELIEQEQINRIEVPESVKLGALLGLERHSRYGIDPPLAERLTKTMMTVMTSPTPEDVEAGVHDWLRSTAAAVLANQYAKTPTKEIQTALTKLIADKGVGLDDRCTAAGVLNRITYAPGSDVDGDVTVTALGQLTLDVITESAKAADEYLKKAFETVDLSSQSRGRGYGRGAYGEGYGGEQDTGPHFERRQLFARLFSIEAGGNSLKEGLADEGKGRMDALIAELKPLVQEMDDKSTTEARIAEQVIAIEPAIKSLVESWGLPQGQAAAAEPVEGFAER